ncbi:MAG: NAD(P)H-hydrate dehydratase [Methylovulum sp.]|nr:NAD(P)H-hydrate dehydratase [Methylovulum sp.]
MQTLPLTLYRTESIKVLEQCAIQDYGIPGFELMNRAGEAVFQCLKEKCPDAASVAVVCGRGNNAGDGCIAARLALLAGLQVKVYISAPEKLTGDAQKAFKQYAEANGSISYWLPAQPIAAADVIIDALFGTGLDRPVSGEYRAAIEAINESQCRVIAIDMPSGLSADTGNVMACAVKADYTVTFIGLKQGLFTGQAADYCGEICYSSLAVPEAVFQALSSAVYRVVGTTWPRRARYTHKGDNGHVLVIGGDAGYSGAAKLAGEAALRVGAGLVSIATRTEHAPLMNMNRPELMCHGVETAQQLEPLLDRINVIVLGPGLGQSIWAKALLVKAISARKPLVIDADGLNLLAVFSKKQPDWILTPHPGEASRLLGCPTAQIQQDRFAAVRSLQAKFGGIAVLKGAGTLIASDHDIAVSTTGNPGMATGGMGDVLSGVIAGLVAQGLPLKEAAQQGVYCHSLAADRAAGTDGERGLLASDLMPYLRRLVNNN